MSNPWESIKTLHSASDWLYEPARQNESVLCPACHSRNVIEVWVDGGVSTYLCALCDCEFQTAGHAARGVIRDIPISVDCKSYASLWEEDGAWFVSFNVIDDLVFEDNFDSEDAAIEYINRVREYFDAIYPGAQIIDVDSGYKWVVLSIEDDVCQLDNETSAYQVRFAIGMVRGIFYIFD